MRTSEPHSLSLARPVRHATVGREGGALQNLMWYNSQKKYGAAAII